MRPILNYLLTPLLLLSLSCSSDDVLNPVSDEPPTPAPQLSEQDFGDTSQDDTPDNNTQGNLSELEKELLITMNTIEGLDNLNDIHNSGWNVLYKDPESGEEYRQGIGYMFMNPDHIDDEFLLNQPEGILVASNPAGISRIMGIAFYVKGSAASPPEGFTGDIDVWRYNALEQSWTLHVWISGHNPNGMFSYFNTDIGNLP